MSTIEKVAIAVCKQFYGTGWEATSPFRQHICHQIARSAIEAMREPTNEMLLAGFLADELDNLAGGEGHEPILASYRAMIDEILKVPA